MNILKSTLLNTLSKFYIALAAFFLSSVICSVYFGWLSPYRTPYTLKLPEFTLGAFFATFFLDVLSNDGLATWILVTLVLTIMMSVLFRKNLNKQRQILVIGTDILTSVVVIITFGAFLVFFLAAIGFGPPS